jgi:hypothetical protein
MVVDGVVATAFENTCLCGESIGIVGTMVRLLA